MKSGWSRVEREQAAPDIWTGGRTRSPPRSIRPACPAARLSRPPSPVDQLALVVKGLVADRIPALVAVEVEVAARLHRLPQGDAGAVVARLGRAHERIVGDIQFRRTSRGNSRTFHRQIPACRDRSARAVWTIFRPCSSVPVTRRTSRPLRPLEARDRVGGDRLIGVADVRLAVGVGDRGGDVDRARPWRAP